MPLSGSTSAVDVSWLTFGRAVAVGERHHAAADRVGDLARGASHEPDAVEMHGAVAVAQAAGGGVVGVHEHRRAAGAGRTASELYWPARAPVDEHQAVAAAHALGATARSSSADQLRRGQVEEVGAAGRAPASPAPPSRRGCRTARPAPRPTGGGRWPAIDAAMTSSSSSTLGAAAASRRALPNSGRPRRRLSSANIHHCGRRSPTRLDDGGRAAQERRRPAGSR